MKTHNIDGGQILLGAITGVGADLIILKGFGVLMAGILGALGSWVFTKLIKPKMDELLEKIKKKRRKAQ